MSTLMLAGGLFVALMAVRPQHLDPVADLTDRLRNPRRRALSALRHPLRTLRNR